MCRGLLGRDGPLHIRQQRGEALKEADLIILAGAVCDFRLGYGRHLNRKAKIIAINRNRDQLMKVFESVCSIDIMMVLYLYHSIIREFRYVLETNSGNTGGCGHYYSETQWDAEDKRQL